MNSLNVNAVRTSVRDGLFVIFYKIHIVIAVFVIVVTLTNAYFFSIDPVYQTTASILVKPLIDSRQLFFDADRFDVTPVTEIDINTEISVLISPEVILDVIKKMGEKLPPPKNDDGPMVRLGISSPSNPQQQAIKYITKNLDIYSISSSNTIKISKKGINPEMITSIVNTYLNSYLDKHIELYKPESGVDFYEKQLLLHKKKLEKGKQKINSLYESYNAVDFEQNIEINYDLSKRLKENFSEIESAIAEKERKIKGIKNSIAKDGFFSAMPKEFREDELLSDLVGKAFPPLLVEKERIAGLYPKNSIERKNINRRVRIFQNEIKKEQKKILNGLKVDLESLKAKKLSLTDQLNKINEKLLSLAERQLEYRELEIEMQQAQSSYETYMKRLEEARIKEQKDLSGASSVSIISHAHIPSQPIYPQKKIMLIASVVAGFVAGIGTGLLSYLTDHTVKSSSDLLYLTQLPVFSALGNIKKRKTIE